MKIMFNQIDFGKRIKAFRVMKNLSQREIALKIGVSEQAISKWENGECLPDVYNLKLLAQVLRISVDNLLDTDIAHPEKVVETVMVGGARFEIVERPKTILAGKILYAKDYPDLDRFHAAIDAVSEEEVQSVYGKLRDCVMPVYDIHMSVNFWRNAESRAFGFVREVSTADQIQGIDVYQMPASLYIRAYTDAAVSQLLSREQCEIWELFAYIRNFFMPAHNFQMAENGAQELEVFETAAHKCGYAYMPVMRA